MKNSHKFEALKDRQALRIMSHRGFWGGNILQNSKESSLFATYAGADLVEIDVCRSKDGEYYLYHDGQEDFLLGLEKDFSEYNSEQIDKIEVINSVGSPSGKSLEKLTDYLEWLPEDMLINIDRSFVYWDDLNFFDIIKQSGKVDQIFIKSPVQAKFLDHLEKNNIDIPYVAIVNYVEDFDILNQYSNLNVIGYELIIKDFNSQLLEDNIMNTIKDYPIVMANLEDLGSEYNLLANITDGSVIHDGPETLQKLLDLGFNTIQTDWPNFMVNSRDSLDL
ncbi:glycerophosphodiester phosphodiesterase family protein [Aerococcaceae bacterium DSM 111176]|nr:glycerophosphodiester phosphodiesterase family protein [Aerococcaceae bacterium DSM 111176]